MKKFLLVMIGILISFNIEARRPPPPPMERWTCDWVHSPVDERVIKNKHVQITFDITETGIVKIDKEKVRWTIYIRLDYFRIIDNKIQVVIPLEV